MPALLETRPIRQAIILPVGIIDPPFTDIIKQGESTVSGIEEVKFYMRPILSRIPFINGEAGSKIEPFDNEGNNVKYQWTIEQTAEGEYMAWWLFKKEGNAYETPEFPLTFSDHGPGVGVKIGGIVDGAADHLPVTFNALRNESNFGERRLQKYATLIQIRVTGTYVQPDEEIERYSLPLLDYFSKRLAFELCSPGIDYWGRQHKTITAQSPTEISSYPEMIKVLENLRERFKEELAQDWRDLKFLVPKLSQRKAIAMPSGSIEFEECTQQNGNLIRREAPLPYMSKDPYLTQPLQTGYWGAFDTLTLGLYPFP